MKIFLMTILALGASQAVQASTIQCKNSQYQVILRADESSSRCGFDVNGPDIGLGYMGRIQSVESGVECMGMAYTLSPYHLGNLVIYGRMGTLTFENGAVIYLKCQ